MSKGGWKSRNSNRFFITRKGEFMNTIQTNNTDNKKTTSSYIEPDRALIYIT